MLTMLKQYVAYLVGAAFLLLSVTAGVLYVRLKNAQVNYLKAMQTVTHLTEALEANRVAGEAQTQAAYEAARAAQEQARKGAEQVLQTLTTPENQASREWALQRIHAMEGK